MSSHLSRFSVCAYCGADFTTSHAERLFCEAMCRERFNRETAHQCFYCGELPTSRDHLTPHSVSGLDRRTWGVDHVPACKDCNSRCGDRHPFDLLSRCWMLRESIHKKWKLDKALVEWSQDEMQEVSSMLRRMIEVQQRERAVAVQRVAYLNHRIARLEMLREEAIEREQERRQRRPDYVRSVRRGRG